MIYRLPELSDKEILMDYVSEHRTNGENSRTARGSRVQNREIEDGGMCIEDES